MLCPYGNTPEAAFTYLSDYRPCSGNGRCMSLRQLALYQDFRNFYGDTGEYTDWDADRLYACACDEGWKGVRCDIKECPYGDDPATPGVDEEQLIDCMCDTCGGGFYFVVNGQQTPFIPYDAPPVLIKYRLEVRIIRSLSL